MSASQSFCFSCQSNGHSEEHCQEHAHVLNQNNSPINTLYNNTYNPDWKNYSNLPWKPRLTAYVPPGAQEQFGSTSAQHQSLPLSSPVEQAILNLSKVVDTFVEEQKVLNVQTSQKIEAVESSLNRKLDNMHSEMLVADPLQEEQSVGKEEVKIRIPPPFPQVLRKKKISVNQTEMLEVLRQVKVNIPLLDMISRSLHTRNS